jgi:hypothetical protein
LPDGVFLFIGACVLQALLLTAGISAITDNTVAWLKWGDVHQY